MKRKQGREQRINCRWQDGRCHGCRCSCLYTNGDSMKMTCCCWSWVWTWRKEAWWFYTHVKNDGIHCWWSWLEPLPLDFPSKESESKGGFFSSSDFDSLDKKRKMQFPTLLPSVIRLNLSLFLLEKENPIKSGSRSKGVALLSFCRWVSLYSKGDGLLYLLLHVCVQHDLYLYDASSPSEKYDSASIMPVIMFEMTNEVAGDLKMVSDKQIEKSSVL